MGDLLPKLFQQRWGLERSAWGLGNAGGLNGHFGWPSLDPDAGKLWKIPVGCISSPPAGLWKNQALASLGWLIFSVDRRSTASLRPVPQHSKPPYFPRLFVYVETDSSCEMMWWGQWGRAGFYPQVKNNKAWPSHEIILLPPGS